MKRFAETIRNVNGVKVSLRFPRNVSESVRQRKINLIYDILSAKRPVASLTDLCYTFRG